ncbi:hypothetical protein DIS18_03765 [Algibacter marinivivus]|uniref:Uncharacterized protein n=1 Tax=Algibacter marinivivus TaxID=2100723 RepID=A0A2U2X7F0_9FLAO|nr:hypothetical protein [Algibacter marinivivus]PWH83682.1 hypothetical protein DIS18_03765 [Algibacter marinivivus]
MSRTLTSNLFCSTYGHNYFRLSKANDNTPELVCKCCKGYFKFQNNGSITPVSHRENERFSSILYRKRTA